MENKEILIDSIAELSKNNFDDSLIKDNKICFVIDEKLYRVRMPNQGEQSITEHQRDLIQLEYMKQEGCVTKGQLIARLKENNVVDIEKLEETREFLSKELKQVWFMLATKDSADKNKISEYSDKITKIQENLQSLSIDISTYLRPSLDSRLEKFYLEYLTTLCTEQRIEEEWKRVWNTFEEFNQSDSSLSNKAIAYTSWLLLNRR
jgi:ATP-dependent Clp protease ATP-binding subunit ClpA